ncbi:hypothetical protein [Actinomadura rudentiformis]|uniref:Uncharacterized protein n=1 Tax=Actinomadura rudentiformis TaxID=359158 RepID=A0A6H9YW85_9ACTN|nr:hypothetical protein [Actinomadura rudentiformis]KAB2349016.1 hypothetical protein F8566_14845 [Actinomadura rudentiformis]
MKTPSVPGKGTEQVTQRAAGATDRAAEAARGTAGSASQSASEGASKGAGQVRSDARAVVKVAAVPQKMANLARLLTMHKLLRAVPAAAAAAVATGAAVWAVRRARKR